MWANGGWLCSWDGFSRGYTLVASAGRVPADPWNMLANAKLCFTVFHGIAPSNGLVMSEVAKSRWHDNWVFITFLFCMLTPALAWLRTWVTLKITFMTKEGGGCENNGGICSLDEKKRRMDLFWVSGCKDGKGGCDGIHWLASLPLAERLSSGGSSNAQLLAVLCNIPENITHQSSLWWSPHVFHTSYKNSGISEAQTG